MFNHAFYMIFRQSFIILMGSEKNWLFIWIMINTLPWLLHVQASENHNPDSLNSLIYDCAFKKMSSPVTGMFYNVSLPHNISGMEVSAVRLRTHSLRSHGARFSYFEIPPKVLPQPYTTRVDIVSQNLGNWSSYYYNVPDYVFIAPVLGLLAYNSSYYSSTNNGLVELQVTRGDPIVVRFPHISFPNDTKVGVKCVRLATNGKLEFSDLSEENSCVARGQGHFSIVVPYDQSKNDKNGGKWLKRKWWVILIIAGVVALLLICIVGIVGCKFYKKKRMRKMERESERSEGLDTTWVGRSRMPAASGIRTQPELENSYLPSQEIL